MIGCVRVYTRQPPRANGNERPGCTAQYTGRIQVVRRASRIKARMITIGLRDLPPGHALREVPALSDPSALIRALTRFLSRAQAASGMKGSVDVLLSTDAELRRLNRSFRGKDKATDVLSFPSEPIPGLPAEHQRGGDLAVSLETAARQAREHGHSLSTELRILLLHGLLHLHGLDHETDTGEMAARETALRGRFRLPSTLIARTSAAEPSSHRRYAR